MSSKTSHLSTKIYWRIGTIQSFWEKILSLSRQLIELPIKNNQTEDKY